MARGTKSNEIQTDLTPLQFTEELITNTALGTSRVPVSAVPAMANLLNFITSADTPLTITEALHEKRFLNLNNTAQQLDIRLPDANSIWPDVEDFRRGGLFMEAVVASDAFPVSVQVLVPGQMRGVSAATPRRLADDTLFVGANLRLSDEAVLKFYIRAGLWVVESSAGWRTNATDNDDRLIDVSGATNRQISDNDHDIPVWLTATTPGTLTFQSDIATGTATTVINRGSSAASINFGGHTPIGDASIPAGQAASIVVGPVTSGINKEIFVAASS